MSTVTSLTRAAYLSTVEAILDEMETVGCIRMKEVHWAKEEEHVNSG